MTTASSRPRSEVWRGRPGFNCCHVAGGGPCRPKSTGRAVGVPVGANDGDALSTSPQAIFAKEHQMIESMFDTFL